MQHDPELDELFDAVRQLNPPVAEMVAESHRLGRRRRRHRRLRIAGAALTVTALAGTGLVEWAPQRTAPAVTVAADTPPATPSTAPTSSAPAEPTVPITQPAMLQILTDLLPPGSRLTRFDPEVAKYGDDAGLKSFEVRMDDGQGAADLNVLINRQGNLYGPFDCGELATADLGERLPGMLPQSCRSEQLPDGGILHTTTGRVTSQGLYTVWARVDRADGVMVVISVGNGHVKEGGAGWTRSRLVPPIGLDRLATMVTSPKWQFQVPQSTAQAGTSLAATLARAKIS